MNPSSGNPNPPELRDHIILCGLRNLGYRILEQLLEAEIALAVVVIDETPELRFAEELAQRGVSVLLRDSRATRVLLDAGVTRARALITVLDDLRNLETALEAQKLAPNLRIVSACSNPQIGELLNRLPQCRALSPAALTSDTFVTASLPNQVLHLFKIQDTRINEEVAVVRDNPDQSGTISQLYGRIVPIQVERIGPNDERSYNISPPPNTSVIPQDRVYLIGRVEDMIASKEVGLDRQAFERSQLWTSNGVGQPLPTKRASIWQRLRRGRRLLGRFFYEMGPRFRTALGVFLVILLVSILTLLIFRGDDLASAIYLGLNLIIGQTVINPQDYWLYKIFGFLITFAGITMLGVVNAYITNYIISARLAQVLGQQKAIDMKDHVVLVGLGEVGYRVALGLIERGVPLVVVERDDDNPYMESIRRKGVPVIQADARQMEALNQANIAQARCITITSNDDLGTLETALNARSRLATIRVVMRMFDRGLADKVEESFNIQVARSTSALTAPYFVASALGYEVITTFYARKTPFVVTSLRIKRGSRIDGLSVRDLYTRSRILVLALRRRPTGVPKHQPDNVPLAEQVVYEQIHLDFYLDPETTRLNADDTIYFVGPYNRISKVYELNQVLEAVG